MGTCLQQPMHPKISHLHIAGGLCSSRACAWLGMSVSTRLWEMSRPRLQRAQ